MGWSFIAEQNDLRLELVLGDLPFVHVSLDGFQALLSSALAPFKVALCHPLTVRGVRKDLREISECRTAAEIVLNLEVALLRPA